MKKRCDWPSNNPLMIKYHDKEWGVPVHNDRKIFEFLVLESAQAGLSWSTILNKRENFRKSFAGFDPVKISKFTKRDVNRLLKDAGIIRNRAKIEATVNNAKRFLEIKKEFKTFDKYIWGFIKNKTIKNKWEKLSDIPAKTEESDLIAKDMKKRGFKFLGPTTIYAHMQASGMVNDHQTHCFRYSEI